MKKKVEAAAAELSDVHCDEPRSDWRARHVDGRVDPLRRSNTGDEEHVAVVQKHSRR